MKPKLGDTRLLGGGIERLQKVPGIDGLPISIIKDVKGDVGAK